MIMLLISKKIEKVSIALITLKVHITTLDNYINRNGNIFPMTSQNNMDCNQNIRFKNTIIKPSIPKNININTKKQIHIKQQQ